MDTNEHQFIRGRCRALNLAVLSSVDNAQLTPSVTALKSARGIPRCHETDLPAIQTDAQTPARFSRPYANQRRPCNAGAPKATRTQTTAPERRRATLRPSHASLIFEIRNSTVVSIFDIRISSLILAPLAQLAEQVTLNHWVAGSIPARCT
jgi:hypothetical protein